MLNVNPYKTTASQEGPTRSAGKAFWILNSVLVTIPAVIFVGFYVWLTFERWEAVRENNGDPVTYQHFFWIAPSGYASIVAYFLVPNGLLLVYSRKWGGRPGA